MSFGASEPGRPAEAGPGPTAPRSGFLAQKQAAAVQASGAAAGAPAQAGAEAAAPAAAQAAEFSSEFGSVVDGKWVNAKPPAGLSGLVLINPATSVARSWSASDRISRSPMPLE